MAQPSVAREPSMEEILASIRRIIESNDPITESMNTSAASEVDVEFEDDSDAFVLSDEVDNPFLSQVPANDPGSPVMSDAPILRPTHEPAETQRPVTPAVEEKTLSLADVAARVRAAAGRVPEPAVQRATVSSTVVNPAIPQAPSAPAPQPRAVSVEASSHGQMHAADLPPVLRDLQEMRSGAASSEQNLAGLTRSAAEMQQSVEPQAEPVRMPARPLSETRMSDVSNTDTSMTEILPSLRVPETRNEPMSLPAKIEEAAALISEEAGEQVARSFKELADVFNGIERQSVEDMAREMLKPMLREWLDDNLPTLVERMVREEIERVARGPRR